MKGDLSQSGTLNKRLQFQSKSGAPNGYGEQTTWTTYATLWGSIQATRGQLLYNQTEFLSKNTYNINVRYSAAQTIQVNHRIVCDGVTYNIEAIIDKNMQHRELQLIVSVFNESN